MKRTIISAIVLIAIGFSACTDIKTEEEKTENIQTQKTNNMNNLISIVEIPTTDFARALKFYQAIFSRFKNSASGYSCNSIKAYALLNFPKL